MKKGRRMYGIVRPREHIILPSNVIYVFHFFRKLYSLNHVSSLYEVPHCRLTNNPPSTNNWAPVCIPCHNSANRPRSCAENSARNKVLTT